MVRRYEETHPWISFSLDLNDLSRRCWMLLAEAKSKCDHIAGVPLKPVVAQDLQSVALVKGVHATTSIEGNTLTEEQVEARVRGQLDLPLSRDYLGREVDNVLRVLNELADSVVDGKKLEITPTLIRRFNKELLADLDNDDDTVPGEFRTHSVGVGRYKAAPAEDVPFLVDQLCKWLDMLAEQTDDDAVGPDTAFATLLVRAVLAHLYLAWIHPFGDGNGRTARLVEFALLFQGGVPAPAAHLLSNHYNLTRARYYHELDRTSRKLPYEVASFVEYAMQGFVDGLRDQLTTIRAHQMQVTWVNFVHEQFEGQETPAQRRQKHLVLDLLDDWTPRAQIRRVSLRIAEDYGGKTSKTVTRDLNALEKLGLIERSRQGVRPRRELVEAFLPLRASTISRDTE